LSSKNLDAILTDIVNAAKAHRIKAAKIIINEKTLIKELVYYVFKTENKLSIKAAWILEWICSHNNIDYIIPHLTYFCDNLHKLKFDSSKRPCAKVCELLAISYTEKQPNLIQQKLSANNIEKIIETGFDWLITEQKIAVKAYTMTTLYLFGKNSNWIHSELYTIIQKDVIHQSKGCEARGKKIMKLIKSF